MTLTLVTPSARPASTAIEPADLRPDPEAWSITLFDDRYGVGAQDRLLVMLRQPCYTFATWTVDYVYCEFGDADFLFVPREALPRRTTRLDETASLHLYRNTFSAFESETARSSARPEE